LPSPPISASRLTNQDSLLKYVNNHNTNTIVFRRYKYTNKSYLKEAFDNKNDMKVNTKKAFYKDDI